MINRDRVRTTVNVWGDSLGAAIIEHISKKDLLAADYNKELSNRQTRAKDELTLLDNTTDEITYM